MAKLKQKSQMAESTKLLLEERKKGNSIDSLATTFKISRSRVYQILDQYGDPLPKELQQK